MLTFLLIWTHIVGSIGNSFESLKKSLDIICNEAAINDLLSKHDDTDFNKVDQAGWYPIHAAIVHSDHHLSGRWK